MAQQNKPRASKRGSSSSNQHKNMRYQEKEWNDQAAANGELKASELSKLLKIKAEIASRFLESRNYESGQKNGQRISTHRSLKSDGSINSRREVFIGKLPRDLFEDELLPKFEKAGRVLKMRLMMDFSSSNRGFAFVQYVTPEEAAMAVKTLHQTLIRDGEPPIAVLPSFDNKKLYLSNLPYKITSEKLLSELKKVTEGIESVSIPECPPDQESRHAYITFKTHEDATQARRILCPGDVKIYNRLISVEWAKPELQISQQQQQQPPLPPSPIGPPSKSSSSTHQSPIVATPPPAPTLNAMRKNGCTPTNTNGKINTVLDNLKNQPRRQPLSNRTHNQRNNINLSNSNMMAPGPYEAAPARPALVSTPNILGETARQMLAACPPDPNCTILIENIDLSLLDETRLQNILQLVSTFTITRMARCGPLALEVSYQNSYEAYTVTNLINRFSDSFKLLAVPGKLLQARQLSLSLMYS